MQCFGYVLSLFVITSCALPIQQHPTHMDADSWHSQRDKEKPWFQISKGKPTSYHLNSSDVVLI